MSILFIIISIFYILLLGNLRQTNRTVVAIIFMGLVFMNILAGGWSGFILLILPCLVLAVLFTINVKYTKPVLYFGLLFSGLMLTYPNWYQDVYPNNNLEEDLHWAVHDAESILSFVIISAVVVSVLYLLNRFVLKMNSLWAINLMIASTFMYMGLSISNSASKVWIWLISLIACWWLSRKRLKPCAIWKQLIVFVIVTVLPILHIMSSDISRKILVPEIKAFQGERFSYIAEVSGEKGVGFINERGEEVIPCMFEKIVDIKQIPNGCLIETENIYGNYILNERGEVISDEYLYYHFAREKDYILVCNDDGWGVIDSKGKLIVENKYERLSDVCEAEGLHTDDSEIEYEELYLETITDGQNKYEIADGFIRIK